MNSWNAEKKQTCTYHSCAIQPIETTVSRQGSASVWVSQCDCYPCKCFLACIIAAIASKLLESKLPSTASLAVMKHNEYYTHTLKEDLPG